MTLIFLLDYLISRIIIIVKHAAKGLNLRHPSSQLQSQPACNKRLLTGPLSRAIRRLSHCRNINRGLFFLHHRHRLLSSSAGTVRCVRFGDGGVCRSGNEYRPYRPRGILLQMVASR